MQPFVIFGLPRCRTYWISRFLQYGPWQCAHDQLRYCRSLDDVRSWLAQPWTGSVETAIAPFWRLLERFCPEARVVTLRRPVPDVVASLARAGLVFDEPVMERLLWRAERKLDQIEARIPGVLRLTFDDLADEGACAALFQHCLDLPLDHDWWQQLAPLNLQISMPHLMRYLAAHAQQLEKLRRMARFEMLRSFRRQVEMDGITYQQEPLAQAFSDRDGERLMSEECMALGEYPEAWQGMNIPLLERLEARGALHIYTARSNGRMFGYVVSAIGEAFHARDQLEAEQVSFFADPSWPGLGRKLQHAAVEDLRAQGVDRVLMFEPAETRVGLLYRRLGAKQTGQRFVMELQ